ncbi:hypothetical protein AGABI1DRAFT_131699 [Agaricus bisporus var. burnettii JB137-S8]|uniref:Uncharacterized protein n=1 Tax=Agaricus bisporus var. burnettii (strain JB137-S8 / ATCC MYA-4627 / FGSC 10392) TaxID=597362 RepID=K5WKZ5_AGABU|nr:uncharacterized protein AGABI1DRAFT_131699 [Agaricus bisporus var. burnettii JB137-S8]EKM75981.1 hypothetical protein AGABI1DRAFT_131699 [Agaricus bisporus var. burnettii JB137-S8]
MFEEVSQCGPQLSLLLAFHLGMESSCASYSFIDLRTGQEPSIQSVRFRGKNINGGVTVPTVVQYYYSGQVRAVGAETELSDDEGTYGTEDVEDYVVAERFIPHFMTPKSRFDLKSSNVFVPPLPCGKSPEDVLSDFLRYLYFQAREYVQEVHPDLTHETVMNAIHCSVIFSDSDYNQGIQQALVERAAEKATLLVSDVQCPTWPGLPIWSFIAEENVYINQCMHRKLLSDANLNGDNGICIVNVDSESSRICSFTYRPGENHPLMIVDPQYYSEGFDQVTELAEAYLREHLIGSTFYDDIPDMEGYFDRVVKPTFCDLNREYRIFFDPEGGSDLEFGIANGTISMPGGKIASFFEPLVQRVVEGILEHLLTASKPISHVIFTGVASNSEYLFNEISRRLGHCNLQILRPGHSATAPAEGAVAMITRLYQVLYPGMTKL